MKKTIVLLIILVGVMFLSSCVNTDGQRQSVYQGGATVLGALAGQVIGHDTKSTLIGAGVGYVAGGLTKEWVHPQQPQVVCVQPQKRPRLYSDHYIKQVKKNHYRALEILDEYEEMATYCSDYPHYRRPSAFDYESNEGRRYQGKRDSYKSRAVSDCTRAKGQLGWARAVEDEYNKLIRMGYF